MPRRIEFCFDDRPFQFRSKTLKMNKAYSSQDYQSGTILTNDAFTYIGFYFSSHRKIMKYRDIANKTKYGDPNKYHYSFYWKQAESFYKAAKNLPIDSSPLASYYCMLNAVKALISFRKQYVDDFISNFQSHGLNEDKNAIGDCLETTRVKRLSSGVFAEFGKLLDNNFLTNWPNGASFSLRNLLYNLVYIHRAFITTYSAPRSKKIQELFLPLVAGSAPTFYKGNDNKLYLVCDVEKEYFSPVATSIPPSVFSTLPDSYEICNGDNFRLKSKTGAKKNADSISTELKNLNNELRKNFQYIKAPKRLWYIKRERLSNPDIINTNSMLISMAAMHRFSEIVRYKPEQLAKLMDSQENWLVHEFLTLSLDQFIDEIAAEITGQELMCTGVK